jgi:hypothetical protein
MLDKLLKITGTLALYGCTSMFLATIILGVYLKYAWQIDHEKWIKMLAVAQGFELAEIQQAVEDRIAEMTYEEVLEHRAKRTREDEFKQESIEKTVVIAPPPVETPAEEIKPEQKKDDSMIKAFEKRLAEEKKKAADAGLAEETRLLENMEPEQAKEVIRRLLKDGAMQRVLTMLLEMEERNRGKILYTMQGEEELKDLCDILQRIGNGEPQTSLIDNAAKAVNGNGNEKKPYHHHLSRQSSRKKRSTNDCSYPFSSIGGHFLAIGGHFSSIRGQTFGNIRRLEPIPLGSAVQEKIMTPFQGECQKTKIPLIDYNNKMSRLN